MVSLRENKGILEKDWQNKLISRALSKESTEEELKILHEWLESSPEDKKHYEELRAIWENTEIKNKVANQHDVLNKLLAGINASENRDSTKIRRASFARYYYSVVAASIVLLIMVGYFAYQKQKNKIELAAVATREITKSNPKGQKSKIFLPDGSIIWLNAESTVNYNEDFGDSIRKIRLTGEAFFEVEQSPIPFIISHNDLVVTALGTAFNVSAFPDEKEITVALVNGKVSVRKGTIQEILNPNESVRIRKEDNETVKHKGDALEFSAWKDGILTFKSDPLESIIGKIERWYGVEVEVEGVPRENLKFTGRFENEYLKNILESLVYGQRMKYQIRNKNVRIIFD